MTRPTVEVYPLRSAVRSDAPTTLDVLIRILPTLPETMSERPPLNLGLVLDRSGSMGGDKINFALTAARMLIEQLTPTDRFSLTIFDDVVETLAVSALAVDRQRLLDLLPAIQPGGSTALHEGWSEGVTQVRPHVQADALNRVLLLTDGLANVGEVNPDVIATSVKQASLEGVGTSAMGVGADYNEDLIEAMARAGDGNYYYIQSPDQLPAMFQTELLGLLALVGRQARLTVTPAAGVVLTDVLNDLERDPEGRLILPNLIGGLPVEVVLRFEVPAQGPHVRHAESSEHVARGESSRTEPVRLALFEIAYESPADGPQQLSAELLLPVVAGAAWVDLPPNVEVMERGALQVAGRLKRQATQHMDRDEIDAARTLLKQARQSLEGLPATERVQQEQRDLNEVETHLDEGHIAQSRKSATYQHYRRSHSK
jgi:Ca-activated chloride channel family protein